MLTASGGPFRGRTDLTGVTREEALAHPTWEMGGKITIDSATLINKGLEMIEAHHLFGVPYERIDVVVHPQSIVHSLVHLNDGASLAHLGYPDMRVPISYALHYPERADVPLRALDLAAVGELTFEPPDTRDLPLPAPGARGRRGGRHGALRAQRRQRGRGRGLPRRRDPLHRRSPRSSRARSSSAEASEPTTSTTSSRPTPRRAASQRARLAWRSGAR